MKDEGRENLAEYILRVRPGDDQEMEKALTAVCIGWREALQLKREMDRLSVRGAELIRRRAPGKIVNRYIEELRLLFYAAEALEM